MMAGQQLVVGRDPAASLQLQDEMSSRRHFMIVAKGQLFGLKDLASANGTLVNGRRMNNAHRLEFGDMIQVGETLLSWLPDEETEKKGGLIGHTIGGYRIDLRLGRGAMGTVFRAIQVSLGRTVALKVLSPELTKDPKFCDMFLKEARAAGGLNHSNIIQVYDVGDDGGQYFFSMEFAGKGSVLEELGKQKTLPLPRAIKVVRDACAALDYAERKGLVHRDIKPDNLMVTEDGTVKLGDLGLAMSTHELSAEQDGVFGTPHYIAPEQAMGKPIDHRADIYALGASFYRMLAGRTLFEGATVKEILKQQVREPHKPINTYMHDCPAGISTIIDRMLRKNPAERYQHASDVAADLANFEAQAARKGAAVASALGNRAAGLPADQSQQIAAALRTRNLVLAVIAATGAIAALAVVLWMFVFNAPGDNGAGNRASAMSANATSPAASAPSAETLQANEKLNAALVLANEDVNKEDPGRLDYEKAIKRLNDALASFSLASQEAKDKLTGRKRDLEVQLRRKNQDSENVRGEWEAARQEAAAQAEEFRFKAGAETLGAFVKKFETEPNADVRQIAKAAGDYMRGESADGGYPEECGKKMRTFQSDTEREERRAGGLNEAQRLAAMKALLAKVRAKQADCDDDVYKKRLETMAKDLDGKVTILQAEADRALRGILDEAFVRCGAALDGTLRTIGEQVACGHFSNAEKLLADFEESDPAYKVHRGHERFTPLREDISRRRSQSALIVAALATLRDAIPKPAELMALLKTAPWPAACTDDLGGPQAVIAIQFDGKAIDSAWKLSRVTTQILPAWTATDLANEPRRKAFAAAMAHLLANDRNFGPALLKAPAGQVAPAAVGVFALLTEMGCYTEAFPFIELAYRHDPDDPALPIKESALPVIKEYMGWGLLGKIRVAVEAGNEEEQNKLISTLNSQFADTRAFKGRK